MDKWIKTNNPLTDRRIKGESGGNLYNSMLSVSCEYNIGTPFRVTLVASQENILCRRCMFDGGALQYNFHDLNEFVNQQKHLHEIVL